MIAMNAPVILNQALTVHGEVSIHPGSTQTVNTLVARDAAIPLPSLQQAASPLHDLNRGVELHLLAGEWDIQWLGI